MLLGKQKAVQLPPEFRFTQEDIGDTGSKRSWRAKHQRFLALASLATVGFSGFGGGYLGYRIGESEARATARAHAKAAVMLRQCVSGLRPHTEGEIARVWFSSLSEDTQFKCDVINLADSADNAVQRFVELHPDAHFKIGRPNLDAELTFDVGDMRYDAAVEEYKSRNEGNLEKVLGATFGGLIGLGVGGLAAVLISNPSAYRRGFRNFGDAIGLAGR